jgi:hypothetical protein
MPFFFAANYPVGVDHGPQVARPTPTSMTIAWVTTLPVVGTVEYGLDATYGATATDGGDWVDHAIALSPLSPATAYHYRILDDGAAAGGDHTFRTPPAAPEAPFRIVAIGDTGTGDVVERDSIARVASLAPDLVLNTGDVAYRKGTSIEVFSNFLVPFADLMATTPLFPVLGNHDVDSQDGKPTLDSMVLPVNSTDGTSRYYSLNWANTHIVALDSNSDASASSPQGLWLRSDLALAATRPGIHWAIVFFHHPAYSSSMHGSDPSMDVNVVPVLDQLHVDLVLNGHDHDYERSFPMLGGTPTTTGGPDYTDPAGTIYVVTGGGGKDLYDAGTSSFTAFSESVHHVTRLDIAGPTLRLTAVRSDGTVLDRMSITKTH